MKEIFPPKFVQNIELQDPYIVSAKTAIDPDIIIPYTRPLQELVLLYARDVLLMKEDQYIPKKIKQQGRRILTVGKISLSKDQESSVIELLEAVNFCIRHCQYLPLGLHAARVDLPSAFGEHTLVLEKYSEAVGRTLGNFRVIESQNNITPNVHRWMRTPDAIGKKIQEAKGNERFWT